MSLTRVPRSFSLGAGTLAIILFFSGSQAADGARRINLEEALEMAFSRDPSLIYAKSMLEATIERQSATSAGYSPVVNLEAAYLPQSGNFVPRPGMNFKQFAADPSLTPYHYFNFSLAIRQTVYDFGRTNGLSEQAKSLAHAAESDLTRSRLDLWSLVVSRYVAVLSAQEMVGVAERSRDQATRYANRASAMFESGLRPLIDVVRTEADAQNAASSLLQAQDTLALSQAALAATFGSGARFDFVVEPLPASFGQEPVPEMENAISEALASRPEVTALLHRIRAQEAVVQQRRASYYPVLFAQAGFNYGGTEIDALVYNWSLGIGISLPLFSGFSTRHEIGEAEAVLGSLRANLESLRLQIRMEAEQALRMLVDARTRLGPVNAAVRAAREALRLADGRYEAGTGNQVELLDAQASLANAEASLVRARYELAVCWVNLQRVLGRLPERWKEK